MWHRSFLPVLLCLPAVPLSAAEPPSPPIVYTTERLEWAQANLTAHAWARDLRDDILERADAAARQPPERLAAWFAATTPTNQCSCPHCGAYWLNYIWEWDPAHPEQLQCNRCETIVSEETYPANRIIYRPDPQGNRLPHPVFEDTEGRIFPVQQAISHYKSLHAFDWIEALGEAYALTADERYATTAIHLLDRLATVYPGYAWHDNFRFEPRPWGWAGKLTGWHLDDARALIQCASTYDAIRRSPALDPARRQHIEKNLLRLGGQMLTAVRPLQGISNDVAYRFGAVALLGRLLDDRALLAWVLDGEESYAAIVDKLFFADGTWHERTPSYHNMLMRGLYLAPYFLDGYIDPVTGKAVSLRRLPKLVRIHHLPFLHRFPDGSLPPVNDSRFGTRIDPEGIEAMAAFFPDTPRWLDCLLAVSEGDPDRVAGSFALFNRPPDFAARLARIAGPEPLPRRSADFKGLGLFMLRRGEGAQQTVFTLHHHKFANSHSHYDALSTILYAEGREMLSDLGYPLFGIRERSTWYIASLSHNTLTVDTQNQRAPNGVANFLHDGALFTACEGESWDSYRFICEPFTRQIALVDTPSGRPYAVDIFRGGGGQVHDLALHGEGPEIGFEGLELTPIDTFEGKDYAYEEVSDIRQSEPLDEPWSVSWRWDDGAQLDTHVAGQEGTRVIATRSPGMRTRDQQGRRIHSVFQRREGADLRSEFVAVFDPHRGEPLIEQVEKTLVTTGAEWAVVVKVRLVDGATDYILSSYQDLAPLGEVYRDGAIEIAWESRFGVVRVRDGAIVEAEWVHAPMEGLAHEI